MKSKISILMFLITASIVFPQSDVKIISSDFNSIVIEYTTNIVDSSFYKSGGDTFRKIEILNGILPEQNKRGLPAVPEKQIVLGVPSEFGNTIEVLSANHTEINGQLIPIPFVKIDTSSYLLDYKKDQEYYEYKTNEDLVSFGEYGLIRDVGAQTIKINPIKFDASTNKIKIYSKIVFKINFSNSSQISSNPADDLLDGILINYNVAKYWNNQTSNKNLKKAVFVNSVLASGKWIKFEAQEEGIYKITRANLSLYGIDAATVDPRTIKIYNNGGKALPESITAQRPADLTENAILVYGEEDGRFDDGDYIVFYGRGSSFWDYGSDGKTISRFFNPYSSKNYFWITSGGENGKRMVNKESLNTTAALTQSTSVAFADWEVDKVSPGKSGRQFVGDNFNQSVTSRTYTNALNGRIEDTPINYNFRYVVGSSSGLTLNINENGTRIFQQSLAGYGGEDFSFGKEHFRSMSFSGSIPESRSVLNFSIVPAGVTSTGYLDYFTIQYDKELKAFNDNLAFYSSQFEGIIEYRLNGFSSSNIKVYDITDYSNVKLVTKSILSGGECKFQFTEGSNLRSKYYAVGSDNFKSPSNPVVVQNSNLHGEQIGAKFLIITHKNFIDAANQLKTYRENQAKVTISTIVADVEQIANEFSNGTPDPSGLRDYIKYAYDNWQIKPQYVLLFGKGTYDYKNAEGYGDNFVTTWQTVESLVHIYGGDSYTTDDFFVKISGNNDSKVDLALGRITCSNSTEAINFVNKIIDYEQSNQKGQWRNKITLIADDGYSNKYGYEGSAHTSPCEILTSNYFPKYFDINKIYGAAYPVEITGQGKRQPLVNQGIIKAINEGSLFVNYIGHGSPEVWADERVFEKSITLPQLTNDKYFFLSAATCDFGYFDIPNYQSTAEALLFKPNSGAIAVYSANRVVFSTDNHNLNYALVNALFNTSRDTMNLSIPVGKASMILKQSFTSINDQKYNIFGDPTLRLLVPQYPARFDSINGQTLAETIQVKALSKTRIVGKVLKSDNTLWSDFNGEGILTFYDSERTVLLEAIDNFPVTMPGGIIFNGRISINNGVFIADFIVPKDISYENKKGKIVLYFQNSSVDGIGYASNVIVGGTDYSVTDDGTGPEMEIFFDSAENSNGYLVNPDATLIVKLSDQTGLNTTGTGIGHKLEGVLNQQLNTPIDFSNYFTGDLDAGGKTGAINYKFSNLDQGDYEISVKAWDVFNNPSEQKSFFTVVDGSDLEVKDIYNYPNPFSEKTQFTFQQNLNQPIDVKIKVYSIAGRMIKEIERLNVSEKFVVIDWDGRDEDGDPIANGTYLYKIIIKSVDGQFSKSVLGKLAVVK